MSIISSSIHWWWFLVLLACLSLVTASGESYINLFGFLKKKATATYSANERNQAIVNKKTHQGLYHARGFNIVLAREEDCKAATYPLRVMLTLKKGGGHVMPTSTRHLLEHRRAGYGHVSDLI
jgi:hypothetical protein